MSKRKTVARPVSMYECSVCGGAGTSQSIHCGKPTSLITKTVNMPKRKNGDTER